MKLYVPARFSVSTPSGGSIWYVPEPPPVTASDEQLAQGERLYHQVCASCHGVLGRDGASPSIVDLRRMSAETHQAFQAIVLGGARRELGMRSFADQMNPTDVIAIHQFVISRAHAARAIAIAPRSRQ